MAQINQSVTLFQNELESTIKVNGKGWDFNLFKNKNLMANNGLLCLDCKNVCCNAVELNCDDQHDDNEIYLYCNVCLLKLIQNNDNKCPVNSHLNPLFVAAKTVNRQILQSSVICPYNVTLMNKNYYYPTPQDPNQQIIDTVNDDKEGSSQLNNLNNNNICNWNGLLDDLITKHLPICIKKNDPSFVIKVENKKLLKIIENQKNAINKLKNELKEKDLIINTQNKELKILKQTVIDNVDNVDNDEKKQIDNSDDCVFNISSNSLEITYNNPNEICFIHKVLSGTYGSCYSSYNINSMKYPHIYEWIFKLHQSSSTQIGLVYSTKDKGYIINNHLGHNTIRYSWKRSGHLYGDSKTQNIPIMGIKGDIIKMKLNISQSNAYLKFYKDNHDNGNSFENIIRSDNIQYRLAVCLYDKGDGISLLSFTIDGKNATFI